MNKESTESTIITIGGKPSLLGIIRMVKLCHTMLIPTKRIGFADPRVIEIYFWISPCFRENVDCFLSDYLIRWPILNAGVFWITIQ